MKIKNIIAHRGVWDDSAQKNSSEALSSAFDAGFGLETDIRDQSGTLVISHDPPVGEKQTLDGLLASYRGGGRLALNVKADGLSGTVTEAIERAGIAHSQCFVFDMAVPDMIAYTRGPLPVFTRCSEHERVPALLDAAVGVWVDSFGSFDQLAATREFLGRGMEVAIVSPELHGRPYIDLWSAIRNEGFDRNEDFALCTDHPAEAVGFFSATD